MKKPNKLFYREVEKDSKSNLSVAYVNSSDLVGQQFNGYGSIDILRKNGIDIDYFVFEKLSDSRHVIPILDWKFQTKIKGVIEILEQGLSVHSILYPFPIALAMKEKFRQADIVHYQMIHNSFYSLFALPSMTRSHPSLWTLHDPWALTGHCIHPFDCEKWLTGCHHCPRLKMPKSLNVDTAALLWENKRRIMSRSDLTILVLSDWMKRMVKSSPIMEGKDVRTVPPGLNLKKFSPNFDVRNRVRDRLSIPRDARVIMLRSSKNPFKGTDIALDILRKLKPSEPTFVITVEKEGLLGNKIGELQVIDRGWLSQEGMIEVYQASDCLLMPSTAESFGFMAIEALACGCPVICLKKTVIEETLANSNASFAMDKDDLDNSVDNIHELLSDSGRLESIKEKGRLFAARNFDQDRQAVELAQIYYEIAG